MSKRNAVVSRDLPPPFEAERNKTVDEPKELTSDDYHVAWICALPKEQTAAIAMLDQENDLLRSVPNDGNAYTYGSIGNHNIVIACLPKGQIGNTPSATVASRMRSTFPNIKFAMMIGIGGAVSSCVRLGDVVVSTPTDEFPGVVQWDMGKAEDGEKFRRTGSLNNPPTALLTAVSKLESEHELNGTRIPEFLDKMKNKYPRLAAKYLRPKSLQDIRFKSDYSHSGTFSDCRDCDKSQVEERSSRDMEVHYGLIASGNQVVKDSLLRDKINEEFGGDVLCIEMEAAGLMHNFPCIIIRGICDYADSHKNKLWQEHAAAVAAAFAKELLAKVPTYEVQQMPGLKGLREIAESHRDIAKRQLQVLEDGFKQKSFEKQEECLQLFRLTSASKDITYEYYKDRVEDRVENTCEWFLNHENFKRWLKRDSGPLLVSADPGCGKSVLAKYLIDQELPRLASSATICYFFFKDQDQHTVRQALCALLHQLFCQNFELIKHAENQYNENGKGLINSTQSLWEILKSATQDPQAGSVILVLDALDECDAPDFENLIYNIQNHLRVGQQGQGNLKYLLTSRPYKQIVSRFSRLLDAFPYIHIPGEDESECISREVNCVIQYRVNAFAKEEGLQEDIKDCLLTKLLEVQHRTYLWVYLVFDYLKTQDFKKTPRGIESTMATIPKNVNQAYEQILNKSKNKKIALKALSIILASTRPLRLSEMNIAMNINSKSQSIHDLDLEKKEDFKLNLRSSCGLFISIHNGLIYLLHQTAREFLLADLPSATAIPSESNWNHSITRPKAHAAFAEVCVFYLHFLNLGGGFMRHGVPGGTTLLKYSTQNWIYHFREASFSNDAAVLPLALRICDPDLPIYSLWYKTHSYINFLETVHFSTSLLVASYFGLSSLVALLLEKGAELEAEDTLNQTSLSLAVIRGYEEVVKLLLDEGANSEVKDLHGLTPLSRAAHNGHEQIIKLLLKKNANIEAMNIDGVTPLSRAVYAGHKATVKLLLDNGADFRAKDETGHTPLLWAIDKNNREILKLILEKVTNLEDTKDADYLLLLSRAAYIGSEAFVKLLLEDYTDLEAKDKHGFTPLLWAARGGHDVTITLLLEKGANLEVRDISGQTPLSWAAGMGHETAVKLLIEKGVNLDAKDLYCRTPLLWAATKGHKAIVKFLLDSGADLEIKDRYGMTLLSCAKRRGWVLVTDPLIQWDIHHESQGSI